MATFCGNLVGLKLRHSGKKKCRFKNDHVIVLAQPAKSLKKQYGGGTFLLIDTKRKVPFCEKYSPSMRLFTTCWPVGEDCRAKVIYQI